MRRFLSIALLVAVARAEPPPAAVEGRVLGSDGKPIAEARVSAFAGPMGPQPRAIAVARTDGNGQFRLERPPRGPLHLGASAPGFVAGAAEGKAGVEIVLARGGVVLRGTVEDNGGGPIAGARVRVSSGKAAWQVETNRQGELEIALAPAVYFVTADADGYAEKMELIDARMDRVMRLRLNAAATLRGRVMVRATGRPFAGAAVMLQPIGFSFAMAVNSDEQGRFEMRGVQPGEYLIDASYDQWTGQLARSIHVGPRSVVENLEIFLDEHRAVRGAIRDERGKPIAGANLILSPLRGGRSKGNSSDSRGYYVLLGVRPGEYRLEVTAPGYQAATLERLIVQDRDLDGVDVKMARGGALEVFVLDEGRRPVKGATVRVQVAGEALDPICTSDAEGRCRFERLPSERVNGSVTHPVHGTGVLEDVLIARDEKNQVTVKLVRGSASIEGRVRWGDGAPADGAIVELHGRSGQRARTGSDGRFAFERLPAGSYQVTAARADSRLEGGYQPDTPPLPVELQTGEPRRDLDLTLPRAAPPISGIVLAPDGKPLAGAAVSVWRKGTDLRTAAVVYAAADGRFTTPPLAREKYRLRVQSPAYPTVETGDLGPGATVKLRMIPGAVLAGAVTREGKSVVDFTVTATPVDGNRDLDERSSEISDPAGRFQLTGLADGEYELVARDRTNGVASLRVRLAVGEIKRGLSIELRPVETGN